MRSLKIRMAVGLHHCFDSRSRRRLGRNGRSSTSPAIVQLIQEVQTMRSSYRPRKPSCIRRSKLCKP